MNKQFYENLYDGLYAQGYAVPGPGGLTSHLYDEQMYKDTLMYIINESNIQYNSILDVGCGLGYGKNNPLSNK